ncbi:YjdF family protein [Bacillus cytotoxicus]
MKLTVIYDGQFWIGIIELIEDKKFKAYRYLFGAEPSNIEIYEFVNRDLLNFINRSNQKGIDVKENKQKKINPKRLQREVAKEMKKKDISTKAQEAIKLELDERKKERKIISKEKKEEFKQKKRELKVQKAKAKKRGK